VIGYCKYSVYNNARVSNLRVVKYVEYIVYDWNKISRAVSFHTSCLRPALLSDMVSYFMTHYGAQARSVVLNSQINKTAKHTATEYT
jgi:hypothetical protein